MILEPCSAELTRIYYYDENKIERNYAIPTISRKIEDSNVIIKKNVFGQRWVLKINESTKVKKKSNVRVACYALVICSLITAVCFGISLSIENILNRKHHSNEGVISQKTRSQNDTRQILQITNATNVIVIEKNFTSILKGNIYPSNESTVSTFCLNCIPKKEVCLKQKVHETPICVKALNENDPTGCGGLCKVNTHFCQNLDIKAKVYQCSLLKNLLRCPDGTFNCGNMCIPQKKRCDGRIDCSNASDETNCVCNLKTHFRCGNNTSCLNYNKRCDRIVDCWDKSDEMNCHILDECLQDEFPCSDGQCIAKEDFCDGKYDCMDSSDEPDGCQ